MWVKKELKRLKMETQYGTFDDITKQLIEKVKENQGIKKVRCGLLETNEEKEKEVIFLQ